MDESGTPDVPGNTSHFVLAGLAIPVRYWKDCDREITAIKVKYALEKAELHIGWILRPYREQRQISNFDALDYTQRVSQVQSLRNADLLRLQRANNIAQYKQIRKNYKKTEGYIHLSYDDRLNLVKELAQCVSRWGFARLFAECVDKVHFDPARTTKSINEQSFEQVVSRFQQFLSIKSIGSSPVYGFLIHDNNETVAKKHTEQMKKFHRDGTIWTNVTNIIETPLFVDSQLTSMVQASDLCAYSLRRYVENQEEELFDLIFQRADRKDNIVVGIRHFTKTNCSCKICSSHRRTVLATTV